MITLNSSQKRSIHTSLWLLDEMLYHFQQRLEKNSNTSVLYHEVNNLTAEEGQILTHEISVLQQLIMEISAQFCLEPHRIALSHTLRAKSLQCITDNISPLNEQGLSAYGPVSKTLSTYLEPKVADIIQHLERIAQLGNLQDH